MSTNPLGIEAWDPRKHGPPMVGMRVEVSLREKTARGQTWDARCGDRAFRTFDIPNAASREERLNRIAYAVADVIDEATWEGGNRTWEGGNR